VRNIGVMLSARDAGLMSTLGRAAMALSAFEKSAQGVGRSLSASAARAQEFRKVGTLMLATGGVIAAGLALAVVAFASFDKEMSNVQAATMASAGTMEALRNQALRLGEATVFSATEVARAQAELAKAGLSTVDILGGALPAALNLAAAGEVELEVASLAVATALQVFNLNASEAGRVADALAAGANKSSTDIEQLSASLNQAQQVAALADMTLEETVGTLALFADEGLRGSDAGTSLRTMLLRLMNPIGQNKRAMDELNLSMFDAQGKIKPLDQFIGELRTSLAGMTDAQRNATLAQIGGADAVRGLSVLVKAGPAEMAAYTAAVTDSGFAAEVAAIKTDNLMGDIERLGGAFQTALIETGSGANGALRALVQTMTDLVNVFNDLPGPVQQAIVAIAALGATGLILGGLITRLVAARAAMAALGTTGTGIASAMGAIGGAALGPVGAAAGLLAVASGFALVARERKRAAVAEGAAEFATLRNATREQTAELLKLNDAVRVNNHTFQTSRSARQEYIDTGRLTEQSTRDITEAFDELLEKQPELAQGFIDNMKAQGVSNEVLRILNGAYREHISAARDAAGSAEEYNAAVSGVPAVSDPAADAIAGVGGAADQAAADLDAFNSEIEDVLAQFLSVPAATDDVQLAIIEAGEHFAAQAANFGKPGLALTGYSKQAIENKAVVQGLIEKHADLMTAMAEQGATTEGLTMVNEGFRGQLNDLLVSVGATAEEIAFYNGILDAIPLTVGTELTVDATRAEMTLAEKKDQLFDWDASSGTADVNADNSQADETFFESVGRLLGWDRSKGTADVNANNADARRRIGEALGRLGGWDRSSGSADVNARDNASGTIDSVARQLAGIDGRTATVFIKTIAQALPNPFRSRTGGIWGDKMSGIVHAQQGLMAGVVNQPSVLFGERATGGEAFIPRYGNPNRSKSILAQAADWYGMELRPRGTAGMGGRGDMLFQTIIHNQINAKSILNEKTLVEAIQSTTRLELAEHDRKLLRSLKSR
jgi:TP901 family phage tail tape measure protein